MFTINVLLFSAKRFCMLFVCCSQLRSYFYMHEGSCFDDNCSPVNIELCSVLKTACRVSINYISVGHASLLGLFL